MQLLSTGLILFVLAGEGIAEVRAASLPVRVERLETDAALPAREAAAPALPELKLVPDWRSWLPPLGPRSPQGLLSRPGPAPVRRLQLRWWYRRLVELPELDRVGRFAHVRLPLSGVSGGPELLRVAPPPPREDYSRTQELTPGWSWWYLDHESWAVGVATGTRFLLWDHAGPIIDPFTTEARWAVFLP